MDKEKLSLHRRRFLEFRKDGESSVFSFPTDCPLEERFAFINGVITPGFDRIRFYLRYLVARLAYFIDSSPVKVGLYRSMGMHIGKGVFISPNVTVDHHFPDLIRIDDHVVIGFGATLAVHEYSGRKYRVGRVSIGRGAVIGAYAAIRCGSRIPPMTTVPWGEVVTPAETRKK